MTNPVGINANVSSNTRTALNAGWITREDASLKSLLNGIYVPTSNPQRDPDPDADPNDVDNVGPVKTVGSNMRRVPVYFRMPENEARKNTYPYITIDYLTTVFDSSRAMQGYWTYGVPGSTDAYRPSGMPAGGGKTDLPIPMNIHYQVSTWCRSNQHDRIINVELMVNRIRARYGAIDMVGDPEGNSTPDDLSTRRLDVLSGPTNGDTFDAQSKRVFRKMYTVSISSEMFEKDFAALNAVRKVAITVARTTD